MKILEPDSHSNQADDSLLVDNAKLDMRNFEVIYRKYYSQIFKFVHKRVYDTDQVNDITSQVFLKAMVNLEKYEHKGFPFSSWLYRIALSELGNMFRNEKAERALKVEWGNSADLLNELDYEEENVSVSDLGKALNQLSEESLNLIEMRYFEKIKLKDAAVVLGLTESNAKVKMHRTLKKLSKLITEE